MHRLSTLHRLGVLAVAFALVGWLSPAHAQCTTEWTNAAGGSWSDAGSWSAGVPGGTDDACITLAGTYMVALDVAATVNSLTLGGASGTQTFALSTSSLVLSDSSSIRANGVLDWQGAQISGAGPLVNDGLIQIAGTATKDIGAGTTIRNRNLTTLDGTGALRFLGGTGLIENTASGTFDLLSDADFTIFNGGNRFDNDGLFRKSGGTDISQVSASNLDFDNSGTVLAQTGTIQFAGGTNEHDNGTFSAASGAEVFFDAGTHSIIGSLSGNAAGVVRMDAGATLTFTAGASLLSGGGATLDYGENGFEWQGGTIGGTITNVDLLRLTGSGLKDFGPSAVFTNAAAATVEHTDLGNLRFLGGNIQFINAAGALYDLQSDADLAIFNGGNVFDNDGTFRKSAGTDISSISQGSLDFDNSGTVVAQTGSLVLSGNGDHDNGTFSAASGAEVFFDAGTHTITGSLSGTANGTIRIDAGATLVDDGAGATINYGDTGFEWQSGTLSGTLANVDLLRLTGSSLKDFGPNAVFTNAAGATVEMTGTGALRFTGGNIQFTNEAGALFDLQSDASLSIFNGGNVFDNDGTFRKSGGTNASQVSASNLDFDNSGTVLAQTGTIQFAGGTNEHDNGTFSAASGAEIYFDSGTHVITGTLSGAANGTIRMDNGMTLVDDGAGATIDYGGTGFEWQGGLFAGTLTNNDLLRLTGAALKEFSANAAFTNATGATIEHTDAGALRFTGGNIQFFNAAGALYDLQSDADFSTFNGGNTFTNNGTFQKSAGDGLSLISNSSLAFNNNALVEAQTGTVRFDGSSTHTDGTFEAALDAEVYFNSGTHTIVGTVSGSPVGAVRLDAGATLSGDTIDFGGTGFEWQGGAVSTMLTNAGLLRLTTGGTKDLNANVVFTNAAGATIEHTDTGTLRFLGGNIQFLNAAGALYDLQSDANFSIFNAGNTFNNSGLFRKSGGGGSSTISVSGLTFNNNAGGIVRADAGEIDVNGPFNHNADALIQGSAGTFDITGATFAHLGDTGPGASPGLLTWENNWAPDAASSLFIELGGSGSPVAGTDYDQLAVVGNAALAGTLELQIAVGEAPQIGDTYTILTAGGELTGTFGTINGPFGYTFDIDINETTDEVTVEVLTVPNFDLAAINTDPTGDPIVVAKPGAIDFSYVVTNNTNAPITGDVFFTASLGATTLAQGVILSGTLPANTSSPVLSFTQGIPGIAPVGTYTYSIKIGQFPSVVVDQVDFTVQVTSGAREAEADETWSLAGVTPWVGTDGSVLMTVSERPVEVASVADLDESAEFGQGDEQAEAETAEVAEASSSAVPEVFGLAAAYPNPFRASTTFALDVPEAALVSVAVYDALGRRVAMLLDEEVEAGTHRVSFDASSLPSGVYLVRATGAGATAMQRITLVR